MVARGKFFMFTVEALHVEPCVFTNCFKKHSSRPSRVINIHYLPGS